MSSQTCAAVEKNRHEMLGVWLALGAAFGFSLKAIFVKLAYAVPIEGGVDAVTLLALRMVFALPVFLWVGIREHRSASSLSIKEVVSLGVLGLLGYYGASILDFMGLRYISAGLERLILFTYPTLTVMIGVIFLGKSLSRKEVLAIGFSYAGIALAFFHDLSITQTLETLMIGCGFVFASALSYAFYLAGSAPMIQRLGAARFTALAMLVSTLGTLLHFFVSQPLSALIQPLPIYGYGAAMALFSTVLPVFMQSAAIRSIGASRAVLLGSIGPMATIFFGWWFLGEPVSSYQMAGTGLVLVGVLLISRK